MKKVQRSGEGLISRMEENLLIMAVRRGMVLAIPAIMAGSFALLLLSIPVPQYQTFLAGLFNGAASDVLTLVKNATMGVISLILLLTISYSFAQLSDPRYCGILPVVNLCAYLIFSVDVQEGITVRIFESGRMFNALLVAVLSSALFLWLIKRTRLRSKSYASGADEAFNRMTGAIWPAIAVLFFFALLNVTVSLFLGRPDFQTTFSDLTARLFSDLGRNLPSGLLYILLMHVLWFFGIHGSNVLDDAAKGVFGAGMEVNAQLVASGQAPTEIMTKTFLDTFVLFGGCGTLLCLLVAIFLCSKRKSVRSLAKMAVAPALFNINELLLFGIPVVLNPIYFVPFLCTPLLLTAVSYGAVALGLVPCPIHTVEWTTPIFLSGYAATGSFAGSLLQLFNLALGVLIYIPFLRFSQSHQQERMNRHIDKLTEVVMQCEEIGVSPVLLGRSDKLSAIARTLAGDILHAMKKGTVELYYQPQVQADGMVTGAEALLRYRHGVSGRYLYPPLVIALAQEAGYSQELGRYLLEQACKDMEKLERESALPVQISVNVTSSQLDQADFVDVLRGLLEHYAVTPQNLGLEVTEQTALSSSRLMRERIEAIHGLGVQILMDDFGMGHTSLLYLQDKQFDVVKLDGSLVKGLLKNERCGDIISSIVYLSESLGFSIVAEYVETPEQRDKLRELGCLNYQGYLYSPAIPFDQFVVYLKENRKEKEAE